MPDLWPFRELGSIGVKVLDCEHKTPPAAHEGYPYIAIPDLVDGRLNLRTARKITTEDLEQWTRRTRPQSGDIIITRRGRVGDSAVIPPNIHCAIGQNLVIVRSVGGDVDQNYLRWATRGSFWLAEVDRLHNVGAVFDSLNVGDIPKMRIFVPPCTDQRAIGSMLDSLDDKIAVNNRIAQTCHDLAQAHSAYAHIDASPKALVEIANLTMGSSPPGESYNEDGRGMPFYQGTRDFGERFPSHRVWCTAPVRTAPRRSTLVSVRAPVGRVNLAKESCCIGRGIASITSRHATPSVLFHELAAATDIWRPYESEGTVFGAINKHQLGGIAIPSLDDAAAKALETVLSALDRRVISAFDENQTLARIRDTLLPRLMSGEIRVGDAEKLVEDAT